MPVEGCGRAVARAGRAVEPVDGRSPARGGIDRFHTSVRYLLDLDGHDAGVLVEGVQVAVGLFEVGQPVGEPVGGRCHPVPVRGEDGVGGHGGQVLVVAVGHGTGLQHLQFCWLQASGAVGDGVVGAQGQYPRLVVEVGFRLVHRVPVRVVEVALYEDHPGAGVPCTAHDTHEGLVAHTGAHTVGVSQRDQVQ